MGQTGETYDVIVLGGGPGGVRAALLLASRGKQVALIEQDKIGGCCVHRGCIPTKTLVEIAKYHGLDRENFWNRVISEIHENVRSDYEGLQLLLRARGVGIQEGSAAVLDPYHVQVKDMIYSCDQMVIATGSAPVIPEVVAGGGKTSGLCWGTTDDFWNLQELPRRMAILGGGVVGCEIACAIADYVDALAIIEAGDGILSGFDREQAELVEEKLRSKGVEIYKNTLLGEFREEKQGICLSVEEGFSLTVDYCLVAAGRRPVLPKGMEHLFPDGEISADRFGRTSNPDVFLIGDANGQMPFAHYSQAQASAAADLIMGEEPRMAQIIPVCAFTDPPVASVGMRAEEIRRSDGRIVCGKAPFYAVGIAKILGASQGFLKLYRDTERDVLVGASMAGGNAAELLAALIPCIAGEISGEQMKQMVFAHPTVSEAIPLALAETFEGSVELLPKRRRRK